MKLSILIPVYNERYTVNRLLDLVTEASLPQELERELIVVDDCSTDGTRELLTERARTSPLIQLTLHDRNQGKGAAIRSAIQNATGDICLIQDADLEYDPADYPTLLAPILNGDADVVYGSRFASSPYRRVLFFWHEIGNRFLTFLSNAFTGLNLTDMETCYKVARADLLKSIPLRQNRFGMEPELTAKFAKRHPRIFEVPISYHGRTYEEGKKITWRDGVQAIWTILKYRIVDDIFDDRYGHAVLHRLAGTHRFNDWVASKVKPWLGQRVLEIGAGLGTLTLKLTPREAYFVSDQDKLHLQYLRARFGDTPYMRVLELDLEKPEEFECHQQAFDSVVCLNVLEHVTEEPLALANIYNALQPGGRAIVLVPRGQWLFGSLDRALGHRRRYSSKQLREAGEAAGFEVESISTFNRVGLWPWFLNARILRRKVFGKLQLKAFDSTIWLWRRIDRLLPWPGLSLVAVFRRPEA